MKFVLILTLLVRLGGVCYGTNKKKVVVYVRKFA
jgi:hypothetical protein